MRGQAWRSNRRNSGERLSHFLFNIACVSGGGRGGQPEDEERERQRQKEKERKAVAVQTRGYCRRGRANVTSSHDWCDCVYSISEGIPTPFLPFLPSSRHSEPTRVMFPVVNSAEGKRPGIILFSEVTYVAFASVGDSVRGTQDRPQDVTLQKC